MFPKTVLEVEIIKLEKCYKGNELQVEQLDFELFYNITWIMAKTANADIKPPLEWLDEFEEFPILEILPEVMEMLSALMRTSRKK